MNAVVSIGHAPFGKRLAAAMDTFGPLCVGIDPHRRLLLDWGLTDDAHGLREFTRRSLEAVGGRVAAIKPQAAFYERHGSAGLQVLEELVVAAREQGTLCIMDAKRGDVGSTMSAYADAFLRDGAPLAADALTITPYLGYGSLEPALDLARETGRGLFIVALTSNPEGREVQHALVPSHSAPPNTSVATLIAQKAAAENVGDRPMGSVGLVIGATTGNAVHELGINLLSVNGPILAPGVGAQGAGAKELREVFGRARQNVLATSSRAILQMGPGILALRNATRFNVDEATRSLRG